VLPGKKYKPEDLLEIVWHWRWLILASFVLVTSVTVGVAHFFLPDQYRSQTTILVTPQRVPESYVRSTITNPVQERLLTIQQTIMSRTRLERIIDEFKLYPSERRDLPMEDVVERMRTRDILVQTAGKGDSFTVAYISDNPKTAMLVAERLASLFINESMQDRQTMATATSDFLQSQLEDARRRLVEQEQANSTYRLKHVGELPSERASNLQVLQNLQMQVQATIDSMNRDRDRRMLLERQLADLAVEAQSAPPPIPLAGGDPLAVGTGSAAAQLEVARNRLLVMQLSYKDDYPDVKRLKSAIKELEAKAEAEALAQPLSTGPTGGRPATPEEAARQKSAADLRTEMAGLDMQLKSKQAEETRLRGAIAGYEGRIGATPIREAEMTALTRDYETLQKGYQSLLAKQEDSKVAANLENRQIGEAFKVIDAARFPERPYSPNRPLIDLFGALGGLGLGIGLVGLIEYRDKSLKSEDDVVLSLSLPVLALVPVMTTARERRSATRRRVLLSSAAALFVVVAAAGAVGWKLGWFSSLIGR
jgi:polysaccharide chain length determinant protein (PEP-CTERM system associated)